MGSLDGVYATSARWRGGHEVVKLLYDPDEISYQTLVVKAKQVKCTARVYAHSQTQLEIAKKLVGNKAEMVDRSQNARAASAADQLYHLGRSPLKSLPMCSYQRMKANAAIGLNDFSLLTSTLSPRQLKLARSILAQTKRDRSTLADFIAPTNSNQQGAYLVKLTEALSKSEAGEQ